MKTTIAAMAATLLLLGACGSHTTAPAAPVPTQDELDQLHHYLIREGIQPTSHLDGVALSACPSWESGKTVTEVANELAAPGTESGPQLQADGLALVYGTHIWCPQYDEQLQRQASE